MNGIWDKVDEIVKIMWLILISIFAPIKVAILVLMFFFILNFFIGFKNDQIINGHSFSLKKAFEGVKLLGLYYAIIFIVNLALSLYNELELAESATKFISWIVCYWYLVNILRNSMEIFPESRGLKFMYDLLTVQILDIILSRFGLKRPEDETKKMDE
jgi:hypothetical protein